MGFSQFMRERQYLSNVSQSTLSWYTHALKWLPSESPTEAELKAMVMRMREAGLKETGCNAAIRAINAYLHWSHNPNIKCSPACPHLKIKQLKEPQLILPTFTPQQVQMLIRWKPRDFHQRRLHLLVLFLLDTGGRITETLSVRAAEDLDLDNLLVTFDGKGRKQRRIPISLELRKAVFKFIRDFDIKPGALLFATVDGTPVRRMTALRSVKWVCRHLGFEPPRRTLHAIRHTFSVSYLRKGGGEFRLQKTLGHSSLTMTRRYANLLTEDLQAMHPRVSLLN